MQVGEPFLAGLIHGDCLPDRLLEGNVEVFNLLSIEPVMRLMGIVAFKGPLDLPDGVLGDPLTLKREPG